MMSYYEFNLKVLANDVDKYETRQGLLFADDYAEAASVLCEEYGPIDEMILSCWDTGVVLSLSASALEDMRENNG